MPQSNPRAYHLVQEAEFDGPEGRRLPDQRSPYGSEDDRCNYYKPRRQFRRYGIRHIVLNDERTIPMIEYGLGSANMGREHEEVVKATRIVIQNGYYNLDGAEAYSNEPALGQAIRESGIHREKLFVRTKVIRTPGQDIQASFDASLQKLVLTKLICFLFTYPF
ncbi:hypothetical protein NUW58_g5407 [Xylaria curta]|uniref:Uncharacterized protein n=1 Tax=Xylaria curta TaxID=42375 RepID=A0ACC1P3B4_9PEZI|nr:hypothetical protein NUW58_g5407 [Xylaria curta]